jgi:hypothetical protein
MTNHRRSKRRRQKGGFWPFTSSDTTSVSDTSSQGFFSNLFSKTKELGDKANTGIGDFASKASDYAQSSWESAKTIASTDIPLSSPNTGTETGSSMMTAQPSSEPAQTSSEPAQTSSEPAQTSSNLSTGGRRKRRHKTMKGGKGNLGLTYYATPVSDIKVVEPNTWLFYKNGINQISVKGGSRKRKSNKRKLRKSRRTRRHKKH